MNIQRQQLIIEEYFEESASGHIEDERKKVLTLEGSDIVFYELDRHVNMYKLSKNPKDEASYKISVQMLLTLIRQHGEKLA